MTPRISTQSRLSALTLIELLVVMGIIAVLAAVIIPAVTQIGTGQSLTQGADTLSGMLDLARQTAMSENQRIEFRVFKTPETPGGSDSAYRVIQLFRVDKNFPLDKAVKLPTGMVVLEGDTYSSLLGTQNKLEGQGDAGENKNVPYKAVMFRPDGSTHLSPDGPNTDDPLWTFTVVQEIKLAAANGNLPDNFATVAVDPVTGRATTYRP